MWAAPMNITCSQAELSSSSVLLLFSHPLQFFSSSVRAVVHHEGRPAAAAALRYSNTLDLQRASPCLWCQDQVCWSRIRSAGPGSGLLVQDQLCWSRIRSAGPGCWDDDLKAGVRSDWGLRETAAVSFFYHIISAETETWRSAGQKNWQQKIIEKSFSCFSIKNSWTLLSEPKFIFCVVYMWMATLVHIWVVIHITDMMFMFMEMNSIIYRLKCTSVMFHNVREWL